MIFICEESLRSSHINIIFGNGEIKKVGVLFSHLLLCITMPYLKKYNGNVVVIER